MHYWLALAEEEKNADHDESNTGTTTSSTTPILSEKPVVLWLNGGPGSSSILGFLQENGPLLINATGGLHENPYAWTKVAHLLLLEAPVGVGYSYCSRQLALGSPCQNTDKYTASASRAALVDFFRNKFPELAHNGFYITGESYAGVYIPTLSKEILDHTDIPLQGIAVGDPCTDNKAQSDSMDPLWYGYKYGLVDEHVYNLLWNECQISFPSPYASAFRAQQRTLQSDSSPLHRMSRHRFRDTVECQVAYRKFLLSSSHGLSQGWSDLYIDDYSLFAPVTSKEDDDMANYMSRPDVRRALHIESPTTTWPYADVGFDYTKEFDACNWDPDDIVDPRSMIDFYREIVPKLQRTIVFNGSTDPCVSYEGTRVAIEQVGLDVVSGYRPWFYNQSATSIDVLMEKAPLFGPNLVLQDLGAQMGGEVIDYEENLSFVTVHGSGHMVPQFRPQAALHMLKVLIRHDFLSPPLPSDDDLATMSDEEFSQAMEKWTERAMSSEFIDR